MTRFPNYKPEGVIPAALLVFPPRTPWAWVGSFGQRWRWRIPGHSLVSPAAAGPGEKAVNRRVRQAQEALVSFLEEIQCKK